MGRISSYVLPELNTLELYRIGDYPVYLPHLVLGIGTTVGITLLNLRGVQFSTTFQNLTTFGLLAVFVVFAALGLWRGQIANFPPLFADEKAGLGPLLSTLAVLRI